MNPTSEPSSPSRGPLSLPNFRRLWVANVCSGIGSTMHDTAAAWAMTLLTTSPTLVTLMQSMSSLPLFLFALPAGALADIVDRRRLVLGAQITSLLVAASLGLIVATGHLTIGMLLGMTFALGMGNAITMPGWQALVPELVEKRQLPAAITLSGIGVNVARALGPILGGLLLAVSGAASAFLLNALTFVGFITALILWKRPPQTVGANAERMLGAMVAAFRYTRHSEVIRAVLIRNGWFVYFAIAPMALLPVVLRSRGAPALEFGLQMGAYGVGGIVTAVFLLPFLRRKLSLDALLTMATVASAVSIGGLGFANASWLVGILMFSAGSAWLTNMTTMAYAGQSAFPNWVRARSSAIQILVVQGALALGALSWGWVTAHLGSPIALRIAAGGVLAALILVKLLPLNEADRLDLTPSRHWPEHDLPVTPQPEAGPVLVSIEYTVRPEDHDRFRAAIAKLRRTRLRDGAFRWSLFHDLAEPEHFRESFLVGSWGEHLRQHERATVEDQRIEEAVIRIHRGTEPPRVNHFLMNEVSDTPTSAKEMS